MKIGLWKKGLVLGIILLFVGIAIQPGIIADDSIESDNSKMVEITIQICKGNGGYDYTVIISQDQAEKFKNLISRTKTKLDAAETLEETSIIFDDAVISLYELGVFPESMSIEDVQRLVNGIGQNPWIVKILERWFSRNQGNLDNDLNFLCLIAGHTDRTDFFGPIASILFPLTSFFLIIRDLIFENLNYFWNFIPITFGNTISLGSVSLLGPSYANGWINTIGLSGIKYWTGSFIGTLPFPQFILMNYEFKPGVLGFTGINIGSFESDKHFYLGTALWVKIS